MVGGWPNVVSLYRFGCNFGLRQVLGAHVAMDWELQPQAGHFDGARAVQYAAMAEQCAGTAEWSAARN